MKSTKSAKLRTASRLIGYIGIGACLLASCLYLLLHEVANDKLESMLGKFDLKSLIYVGIAAGVFLVIAIILRAASCAARKNEKYAEEVYAANQARTGSRGSPQGSGKGCGYRRRQDLCCLHRQKHSGKAARGNGEDRRVHKEEREGHCGGCSYRCGYYGNLQTQG